MIRHRGVRAGAMVVVALLAIVPCALAEDAKLLPWEQEYVRVHAKHPEVLEAQMAGNVPVLLRFLKSVKGDSESGVHLIAGDVYFAFGDLDAANREHRLVRGVLAGHAGYETAIDLLAARHFDEACRALESVPKEVRADEHDALRAYIMLRCGQADAGRRLLAKTLPDKHSSAEEALVGVFGEQQRFGYYKTVLEKKLEREPRDVVTARALGELLICGDFSNPWHPVHHYDEAIARFEKLRGGADACMASSRQAVAELLRVEEKLRGKADKKDYSKAASLLEPHLSDGPACEEAAVAQYLLLDTTERGNRALSTNALETACRRFPESAALSDLLLDRYRSENRASEAKLRSATEKFPRRWFPYSRLALQDAMADGSRGVSVSWLDKGLAQAPDSLALTYLSTMLRLRSGDYDGAIRPATRYLCGLLETKVHHDTWNSGIGTLKAAFEKESPWPKEPTESEKRLKEWAAGPAVDAAEFRSDLGCFGPGGRFVATIPAWFEPALVEAAIDRLRSGPPPPR